MSRLWKKPKSGRLSRFMSEFQQSPKRGGSLVVETGFPASLVDLFFKNRDRLKKTSSKTKRIHRQIQTAPNASPPIIPDARSLEKPVRSKIANVNVVGGRRLKAEKDNKHNKSDENVCGGGNGAFLLMAFKVFIVAVLALSTKKKLTMGITLSAFVLLLTELVAARVITRFRLCNNTNKQTEKPLASVHDENVLLSGKIETFDDSKDGTQNSSSKDLSIRDLLSKDEKSSTSKSSKLKSKIMKKLRSYSNKKKKKTSVIREETLSDDVSSLVSENRSDVIESKRDEEISSPPLMESKGNSMNGIVVIVIVLIGLLSGKIVAIGLTLSCLYLRSGAAKKYSLCI